LTSDDEEAVRKLFTVEALDYLEMLRDYKIEVNDRFILIFKDQKILSVKEVDDLIAFSRGILSIFAKNLKK
jgi:hypothetical protein